MYNYMILQIGRCMTMITSHMDNDDHSYWATNHPLGFGMRQTKQLNTGTAPAPVSDQI